MDHLPTTLNEARGRGWDRLDVVIVTGDAHVDHPSFPAAILGRVLEAAGFRVGVVSRPDQKNPSEMKKLGLPRLFFGVTAGSLDSLVANYTAQKRRRSDDPHAPGGRAGGRPDRALTVYSNLIRMAWGKAAFIVGGGLEASLRRFAHYDYWSDSIRRPILMDCGADVLVHGMGEGPIVEIARRLDRFLFDNPAAAEAREDGRPLNPTSQVAALFDVPGVVYRLPRSLPEPAEGLRLPSAEEVQASPKAHAKAFRLQERNRDMPQWQDCSGMRVLSNPPWPPLTETQLDAAYELPFTRNAHPSVGSDKVPALEQVRFSVTTHRGCGGGCAFCAIGAHQGPMVSSRSGASVLREIESIVRHPEFRGIVNDLGGPTANMYGLSCASEKSCQRASCLWPKRCRYLVGDQGAYLELLRLARRVDGVRRLFVTTGIRTDLAVQCEPLLKDLALEHTSGLMKVAPEHVSPAVLTLMRKPDASSFLDFLKIHRRYSADAGRKQFVLPYLMAAHPGCEMEHMEELRRFMKKHGLKAEQCQIFTPTPGTASTVMYATGLDPSTMRQVFVERDPKAKETQKAMILHHLPANTRRNRPKRGT